MKQNRKGFSLVELIVVLVIMAIIAALCAPNISAYVQAAKIQNYQTVANNLADELQTQLPQSRYWNWDEVKQSAEWILRSDAGRGVTLLSSSDTEEKYQVTGASSDANAVFTVTLTYQPAEKTSQKVDVAVSCDGYAAAKAEQSCSLVLKTNYTDAGAYPVVKKTITTTETNGWKQLDERVKTYDNWGKWLDENNNKQNDFRNDASFPDHYKGNNTLVINTTDYACNSVKFIQFQMPFYCFFSKKGYTSEDGTYGEKLYGAYAFPSVDVNDGAGTGAQYDASKRDSNRENVYVYIGDDSDLDSLKYVGSGDNTDEAELAAHGWVRHDVIFSAYDGTFRSYADPYSDGAKAVAAFKAKYDTTIQGTTPETASNDTNVIYRVFLKNPVSNAESSRGWIVVTGSNSLDVSRVVYMDPNQVSIYVDNGEVPEDCSALLYKQQTSSFYKQAEDGSQLYRQTLYFNITKCGYAVGDELVITLNNVHAKELLNLYQGTEAGWAFYLVSNVSESANETGSIQSIPYAYKEVDANSVQITIPLTWNMYPFLRLSFAGALLDVGADVSISLNRKSTTTTETDETQYTPMLTINGDNTYTNITLDWTKCDYITNVGEVGIQFDKYPSNLKYDVYSKDYTQLASGQSLSKFMMNSNSAVTPSAAADKIVHLYCKGLSPEDISCSIVAPSAPITTDTTTTTTTTTTTSAETETTAKTTSAAETTSTTTSSTTTTTTSATTTTSTTTSTTTETSTTTSTTTTATTSSTTTSAATTSTVTSTSAVTSSSVSTSSTSTSATTSTTTSITATTTTSATETSGSVVTTVVTGVNNYQVLTIPNYKLLSKVEFEFAGENAPVDWDCHFTDSNGWNDTFSKTFRTDDLVNNKYQIDCENINQQGYLKIGTYTRQPKMSIKSVTFYYRNPNVIITNKLPDGYAVDKASGTALLNSSYEFTVTWNPEEYRTPTVKWNGVTMIPVNKEDDKATYAGKIDGDVEIVVSGRKEDLSGNTLVIDDFNYGTEYDISKYWYIDEDGNGQIPKEIQVEFSDGSYNLRAVLSADKFKTTLGEGNGIFEYCASKNSNGGETYVISSDVISKISMIKNAKIKFENWGSNAKVEAIKFVYADNSELAKAVRYMSRKENIAAILDSELSHHAVTTSARETSFTTTPQTTTTTTTTTTAKPIAVSENGKNVGLDETSAAGCDITFSESLFNESGVCYFTITPKAGYTLSDGYTVKVGTEVLSPKNNYNPKTGQWFFWSNKSMTDYTIHVEGISPAA